MATIENLETSFGSSVAAKYQYHEQGKDECHPVTRDKVLAELDEWIQLPPPQPGGIEMELCRWITGIAGVGKTAIALTTVQCLQDRQPITAREDIEDRNGASVVDPPLLCGQYFIHYAHDTSNYNSLFPTLAMQLARISPVAAHIIQTAITRKPSLARKFSLEQANLIFVAPLMELARLAAPRMVVVVIDGVDELRSPEGTNSLPPHDVVTAVLGAVAAKLPQNARLLVLSRPEDPIIRRLASHIKHVHLPTTESMVDVHRYFSDELPKLRGDGFPSTEQLDILCSAAAGHLGWSKQAVGWLRTELEYWTDATLEEKIRVIGQEAGGNLDNLYSLILNYSLPPIDHPKRMSFIAEFQKVLCCLTVVEGYPPIHTIQQLVKPEHGFDVLNCLRRLSSLYATGTEPITVDTIPQPHKSFFDFITSTRAPELFRVNVARAHRDLAAVCFLIINQELHFNMGGFTSPNLHAKEASTYPSPHIVYVCCSLAYHVQRSGESFADDISHFMRNSFLFWLDVIALSVSRPRSPGASAYLKILKTSIKVS